MNSKIHIDELPVAASLEEYRLHCGALEWSLAEPIIINSAQDIKSVADWKGRVEPFRHQVENLMRFCRRLPVTLLADDVGLGKTISAGLILSELISRGRISRAFVVCPKILIPQWVEELESKFGIPAYGGSGSEIASFHRRTEPVLITTYQSATKLLEQKDSSLFDMLILDEAHKVRNLCGSKKPPKMAKAVFNALQARMFKYVLMLTATPIQNRLWDIYSLIECLAVAKGHRNPFGTQTDFAERYIADGKNKARKLREDTAEEFRSIIGDYMFRTRRADAGLIFPDRQIKAYDVRPVTEELQLQRLIGRNIKLFSPLLQTSVLVALMSSPHALAAQLRNMASNDGQYTSLSQEADRIVSVISEPAKIRAVRRVVAIAREQKADWRIVIFTTRKETQNMIGQLLSADGVAVGYIRGGKAEQNRQAILAFRDHKPRVNVIISTDAGAEGVNLQAANVLINYDLPWNPMIVEQRIGRVQRIGSRFKEVWVANVVHANSPEERIVGRLMEKLQTISHTVGDIEAVLEASDDSSGDSFEQQVREMVIASLQGQDMEAAARKAERSIEEAKSLFEEQQAQIDSQLGNMDGEGSADVPMPELVRRTPDISVETFVRKALESEGATVVEDGNGILEASYKDDRNIRFAFDQAVIQRDADAGVFFGRRPVLYQPGKPAFERLVQHWLDRGAAWVTDNRPQKSQLQNGALNWVQQVDEAEFDSLELLDTENSMSGKLVVRARAANAIDSYEKLLHVEFSAIEATGICESTNPREQIAAIVDRVDQRIRRSADDDSELTTFREYYSERLRVESGRSDSGDRISKLKDDLAPRLYLEVVAVTGNLTGGGEATISYRINGATFSSTIPLSDGQIQATPKCATCSITGKFVPIDALDRCIVTGAHALKNELAASDLSGMLALPDATRICEESGRRLLESEMVTCERTGRRVGRDLCSTSHISGRTALSSEATTCQITGTPILNDEIAVSELSGRVFRKDQSATINATGQVAHSAEVCTCNETNRVIPLKDAAQCAVTGATVAREMLQNCEETGIPTLKRILQQCEATGALCSPAGLGQCEITGRHVRKSVLRVSPQSGRKATDEYFEDCAVSGSRLLSDELATCELIGERVDRDLLRRCERSRTVACKDRLICSAISKKYFLPEYTVKLSNGTAAADDEVAWCFGRGGYIPLKQAAQCHLTGLTFSRKLLNESGELKVLRSCLDGQRTGSEFPNTDQLSRSHPDVFKGMKDVFWVKGQGAGVVYGKRTRMGFFAQYFGVLVQANGDELKAIGNVVFGKRSSGVWHKTEQFSLTDA